MKMGHELEICLDFQFPHIIYDNKAKGSKVVAIDFLVVGLHKKCVYPKINDNDSKLHVNFVVPSFFAQD